MTLTEVSDIHDDLVDQTAKTFDGSKEFITVTAIDETGQTVDTKAAPAADTATVSNFVLDAQPFYDLQAYLLTALRLPSDAQKFKTAYPEKAFRPYLDQESSSTYEYMSTTLTDIYKHCFEFKTNTFNLMISVAGYIVNFSDEASKNATASEQYLAIICKPGASFNDSKVEEAAAKFADAMDSIKSAAEVAKGKVIDVQGKISFFKTLTEKDNVELKKVHDIAERRLPKTADLNKANQADMTKAWEHLNRICKAQNDKYAQGGYSAGNGHYGNAFGGPVVKIGDFKKEAKALDAIRNATEEYNNVFNAANSDLRSTLAFRGQCIHLQSSINDVLATMDKAVAALQTMLGVFSNLETNVAAVQNKLTQATSATAKSEQSFRRRSAYTKINDSAKLWRVIKDVATRFQEHGPKIAVDIDQKLLDRIASTPTMEILSTNYGGVDVTGFSKVLFRYGDCIRVRSVEPGFPDPWDRVPKTITLIHGYGKSRRLFICKEFTEFHELNPGTIDKSRTKGYLKELAPVVKRPESRIEILAIVWGPSEVRDKKVWENVYDAAETSSEFQFSNATMSGETWPDHKKSGVVFYQIAGGSQIYQLTGRDRESVDWQD